jgi:hypothetical protein
VCGCDVNSPNKYEASWEGDEVLVELRIEIAPHEFVMSSGIRLPLGSARPWEIKLISSTRSLLCAWLIQPTGELGRELKDSPSKVRGMADVS